MRGGTEGHGHDSRSKQESKQMERKGTWDKRIGVDGLPSRKGVLHIGQTSDFFRDFLGILSSAESHPPISSYHCIQAQGEKNSQAVVLAQICA